MASIGSCSFQISLSLMKIKLEILHSDVGKLVNLRELKIEVNNLTRLPLVLNQMANLRSIICEDYLMETSSISNLEYRLIRHL